MRNNIRKHVVTAVAAVLIATIASPASACCGDGKVVATAEAIAGRGLSSAVGEAVVAVVAWLQLLNTTIAAGFGKVSAEIQRQTAATRVMEEGSTAVRTQLFMEKIRADAAVKYELSPRACFEVSAARASTTAGEEIHQAVVDVSRKLAAHTLFTANTSAAVSKMHDEHVSKYCSQADADIGRCQVTDPTLQNADIRADTLLNTPAYAGVQAEAVSAFVRNLTNTAPTQMIPRALEATPQGKTFVAGQYIEQARASLAAHSLNTQLTERTPIKGLGTAAGLNKADVSRQELIESLVRNRFESPDWYKMVAGFSTENMLREANKMQAQALWMDLQRYKTDERISALTAGYLAITAKQDAEARMRALRAAAEGR
ncbi:MAG: hypothetical protein WC023_07960 [Rhodocyclaceae bacterium]